MSPTRAANAYRSSFYTTPFHIQLAQLHKRAWVLTHEVAKSVEREEMELARQSIQEIENIIAFLRSSLDLTFEAAEKADAAYAFYYNIMVQWFLNPSSYVDNINNVIEFWDSWAQTWEKVANR